MPQFGAWLLAPGARSGATPARGGRDEMGGTRRRMLQTKHFTWALMVAAGWHMHLDILLARTMAGEAESFWDGWSRLMKEYEQRIPA